MEEQMEVVHNFITQFHNIKGDLIGDRRANLFKLLRTPSLFSDQIELDTTLKHLKPLTYQEQLFYLEVLIYFKRTNELLDILQQGNEVFTSKILKQQWFLESAFKDINVDWFINDLLPCLSLSVKKKLITRIARCWNEKKVDVLFDGLYLKYGFPMASPILIKCTVPKIQCVIEENDLKLRTIQVLQLYNKSEDLFLAYLNHINCLTSSRYDDEKVLIHIAKKNPKLFLHLTTSEKIKVPQLGTRMSKLIVKTVENGVPGDIQQYSPFLKTSVLIRKFGRDLDPVLKNKFPYHLNVHTILDQWLRYYPRKRRWEFFSQACFEKYPDVNLNKLLLDMDHYRLIKLNAPTNIITIWAELNYKGKNISFLQHYELYRAIDIMKEKLETSEDTEDRKSYIAFLISLCHKKDDLTALCGVLEYICTKYKDETIVIRVLNALKSWNWQNFNENIWRYINELICYLKDQENFSMDYYKTIMEKQLEYLVRSKKEYKAELLYYIRNIKIVRFSVVGIYVKNAEIEKIIYTDICKIICEPTYTCSYNILHLLRAYLLAVVNFSLNNPDHRINIMEFEKFHPIIHESFEKTKNFNDEDLLLIPRVILYNIKFSDCAVPLTSNFLLLMDIITNESKSINLFSSVLNQILKEDRTPIISNTFSYYFEHLFKYYPLKNIIDWFLSHEPETLARYVDHIYANVTLVAGVVNYSLHQFTTYDRNELIDEILKFYFENVFEYYPSDDLVDWFIKYEPCTLQPYFDKMLLYIDIPHLPLVKQYSHLGFNTKLVTFYEKMLDADIDDKFSYVDKLRILISTDDFAKLINGRYIPKKDKLDLEDDEMKELYHLQCEVAKTLVFVHEPYKMLPTVMQFCRGDYLQSTLRSLYKAFYRSPEKLLYSYIETLAKQAVSVRKHAIFLSCEVLNKEHTLNILMGTNERNVSSHKYHFSAILKFFLKNPSPDLLAKVFDCMGKININDFETMESICEAPVPKRYSVPYTEHCWQFFENIERQGVNVDEYLKTLIKTLLNAMVEHLTTNFVTYIIQGYFSLKVQELSDFVVLVLYKRSSERVHNMNTLFQIIPNLSCKSKSHLVKRFINHAREEHFSIDIIQLFYNNWMKHVDIRTSFLECISLKLLLIQIESTSLVHYASGVVDYLEELTTEFEYHAYPYFRLAFGDSLQYMEVEDEYTFFLNVIKYRMNPNSCIFVLDVIRDFRYHEPKEKVRNMYKNVLKLIKNSDLPVVRIYYKHISWRLTKC